MKRYIMFAVILICMFGTGRVYCAAHDFTAGWDFEEITENGQVKNIAENAVNFDGTPEKQAQITEDAAHNADWGLRCGGGNETWMNAPGLGNYFADKSEMSISMWVNASELDKERYLFSVMNSSSAQGLSATVFTNGIVKMQIRNVNASSGGLVSTASTGLPTAVICGEWVHLVFVIDLPEKEGGKASLSVYVNGALYSQNINADVKGMTCFEHFAGAAEKNDFRIGGLGSSSFNGCIDDVYVYERVLTEEEINVIYRNIQPTRLTELSVNGTDFLNNEDAKVESHDETGAVYISRIFPLKGISVRVSDNSCPSVNLLEVNGNEISLEDAENISLYPNDVITYTLVSGEWEETQNEWKYKITVASDGIAVRDAGFYAGGIEISELQSGTIEASAGIEHKDSGKYFIFSCLRNNGVIEKIKISRENEGVITAELTVPPGEGNYTAEFFVADSLLRPVTGKFEIKR